MPQSAMSLNVPGLCSVFGLMMAVVAQTGCQDFNIADFIHVVPLNEVP